MPTSGPPKLTIVRSRSGERRIARTSDIGLRREPQPPMPMVMPSPSRATTSASLIRLSLMAHIPAAAALAHARRTSLLEAGGALLHEGAARLVGHSRQMQL